MEANVRERKDGVWHLGRHIVPTSSETRWIGSLAEYVALTGKMSQFSEDQTEITLTLPEGYKFGIGFFGNGGR